MVEKTLPAINIISNGNQRQKNTEESIYLTPAELISYFLKFYYEFTTKDIESSTIPRESILSGLLQFTLSPDYELVAK